MGSEVLDFCSVGLCLEITSSSACSDGFEPSNLLVDDDCGFLAAGFVRPPVSLTLRFCCPVVLRQVRLGLRLRQQQTTGVQLLVAASEGNAWLPVGSLWERHGEPPPHEEAARVLLERLGPRPPEEFVDPITCEVMLLPMVLPSGHTVDQATLERHERAEAAWGRPPGDPFSGVPFGAGSRPVPDAALKARIDHFLFEHADKSAELAAVGRTVGRARLASFQPRPPPAPAPACRCGAATTLYSLPCKHAVCRACLLRLPKAAECATCGQAFSKGDAVRLHS
ncbi:uncharacterized protein LOC119114969 [Pollicipes pollicipes]|uniref:uncharacterized protein LOC119114969 n=1 Tax=Pollicipes pollicipes TaxID=41117 RepID=UPI001884F6E4|nr:uncharacterized protein LOC119114969 [Pollicipes pollicipes]